MTARGVHPVCIGLASGETLLDFGIGDDALLHRIDEEHAPGLETAFFADVFGRKIKDSRFRREHDEVIFRDDVAAGTQTVAIERCADDVAVGEGDSRGAVPRFHQ